MTTHKQISQELVNNLNKNVLSKSEMKLLKKCNGVHGSVEEIIKCKSCEVLLK
jgi:hypothetical protein